MKRIIVIAFLLATTSVRADLQTGLISCWKMDETTGTRVDSFGSNNLADNNSSGFGTGKINNAVNLTAASTQYLSNASVTISVTAGFSASLWFKATSFDANYDTLLSYRTGSGDYIEIYINPSEKLAIYSTNTSQDGTGATTFSTGTWYHIVVTFDSTVGFVSYVNGSVEQTSGAGVAAVGTATNPLYIGRETTFNGRYFDGLIDEAGLWQRTLTSTEVTALYNGGSAIGCPFSVGPTPTPTVAPLASNRFFLFPQ